MELRVSPETETKSPFVICHRLLKGQKFNNVPQRYEKKFDNENSRL